MRKTDIEYAWKIAYDSVTRKINGIEAIDKNLHADINFALDQIDREEWFPIALRIIEQRPGIKSYNLANEAATEYLNNKFGCSNLRVEFGGDT